MASTLGAERGLKRFEGFTDAVFAIALTLLFLEIKPPTSPDVARAVAEQWHEHLALFVSFLGIGIYWLQHHYSGRLYAKTDHLFSLFNLGFLFGIMALPYPARLWASHLGEPGEAGASAILAAGLFLPSLFWITKWLYAKKHCRLIDPRLAPDYLSQPDDTALRDWGGSPGLGCACCADRPSARACPQSRRHGILDLAAAQSSLPIRRGAWR